MELVAVGGVKSSGNKPSRKASKKQNDHPPNISTSRGKGKQSKQASLDTKIPNLKSKMTRGKKNETPAKEEGEMPNTEEVYEQFKEVKWMEWCEDVLIEEKKTLERLHRLQTTSAELPKEKVLQRIRTYLQLLGRKIDQIVTDHEEDSNKQGSEKLQQIYTKFREAAAGVATSQINGRRFKNETYDHSSTLLDKCLDTAKYEAWKRRRSESDPNTAHLQPHHQHQQQQQHFSNGTTRMPDSSLGILGAAPSHIKPFREDRPQRTRGPKQGFT
ncbi:protein CHROMATIN REMODELING 5-like [Rutidosis leptorrhynchoides]|uniref:protein CHROMATIN REMODELING 5-like n=1 Tax=Rutidosis leptorrhynchoides TaxID=125765 RepID=UPI003A99B81C